jgi:hypothetical protein
LPSPEPAARDAGGWLVGGLAASAAPRPGPAAATAVLVWASCTIRPRAVPIRAPSSAPATTRTWPRRRGDRSTGPPSSNTTLTTLPEPAEAKRRELELALSASPARRDGGPLSRGVGDVQLGTDHFSLNPANEEYRLRRGQVAKDAAAEQPPRFEAGVGVSAPRTPRRPRPCGGWCLGSHRDLSRPVPTRSRSGRLAPSLTSDGRSRSMPDLWDTKSRTTPSARPMSSPNQPPTATTTTPRRCRSGTTAAASGHPPMS